MNLWESLGGRPIGVAGGTVDRQIRCEQALYLQMVAGQIGGPIVRLPSHELAMVLASSGSPAASVQSFSTIVFLPGKLPPIWRNAYQLRKLLPQSVSVERIELKPSSRATNVVSCLLPRFSSPTPKLVGPKQPPQKQQLLIQKSIASKIFRPRP